MQSVYGQSEREIFRDNVRRFLNNEIQPHYAQWEKDGIMPKDIWLKLGEQGMLCVDVPEAFGGCGGDFRLSAVVVQEMSRMGFTALATNVSVHSDIVAPYILHLGSDEQRHYWLPKLISGESVGAIAMTEPGAGSDLQGMRTKAEKTATGFCVNGQKTFITNGQHAGVVITACKTDANAGAKGISLLLIDTSLPGYSRGRNLEKIGQHAGDTSELFFEDVQLPATALLGREGQGFVHLMQELPRERLILAVGAMAACEGMLSWTVDYVTTRTAFSKKIAEFQNTRFKLAEMSTAINVHNAFVSTCVEQYDAGELTAVGASQAKLATTELQCKVADECLQLFGGYGYMLEYPIARAFVDARIQRIYGGTSEIMKEIIARELLGR